ncbi:MAG: hypothetical protein LQ338_006238, partial [Usnochroma carphineum]
MASKWTTEAEVKALVALIHALHDGSPKLTKDICNKLEVAMEEEGFSGEAIRQRLQKMLRDYAAKSGSQPTATTTSAVSTKTSTTNSPKTPTPADKKRKAADTMASPSPGKRAKTVAGDDVDKDDRKDLSPQIKAEETGGFG